MTTHDNDTDPRQDHGSFMKDCGLTDLEKHPRNHTHRDSKMILVPADLLDRFVEIACDYINPTGESHHGLKPISYKQAHEAILTAGKLLDSTK